MSAGSQTRQRDVARKASFGGKSCNALAADEPGYTGGVTKQIRQCSNLCDSASARWFSHICGTSVVSVAWLCIGRDCGWLDWTPFSACSATCGNGTKSRSRDQLFVLRTNRSGGT